MASRKVNLMSSDGVTFEVDEIVALEWQAIKPTIEGDFSDGAIPLPNVTSSILSKVIEYSKTHLESSKSEDHSADGNLKAWDAEFVNVDVATLFQFITAANYLNIPSLMDLTCQRVADMMKGQSVEDIRKTFNITNDYTPEEEKEIRQEFPWAFE